MAQNGKVGIRPIGLSPESTDLVVSLDAMYENSYVGTGTSWNDLSMRKNNATFINEPVFDIANDGIIKFEGGNYATIVDNPTLEFGNEAFTVEVWVKFTELNGYQAIVSKPGNSEENGFMLYLENDNTITAVGGENGWQVIMTSTVVPVINEWNHLVVTRTPSGIWNLCINGTEQSAGDVNNPTFAFPDNDTNMYIGAYTNFPGYTNQPAGFLNGYVGMVRVYKGLAISLSQILANYQESVIRFGDGISLDMPFVQDFNDHSDNNRQFTVVGNPTLGTPGLILNGYNDWSNNYLTIDGASGLDFHDKNFAIEAWIKLSDAGQPSSLLCWQDPNGNRFLEISVKWNNIYCYASNYGEVYSKTITMEPAEWSHIAVVRKNNVLYFYQNGVSMGNSPFPVDISTGADNHFVIIGGADNGNSKFFGTIGSLKVYKKSITKQVIVNHFNEELPTYLSSVNAWTLNGVPSPLILRNGATYDAATETLRFDGINDYAETNFVIPEGDFSFGGWAKSTDMYDWSNRLMGNVDALSNQEGIDIIWQNNGQGIIYSVARGNGGNQYDIQSSSIIDLAVLWNHVVITYDSINSVLIMYVNGQEVSRNDSAGIVITSSLPFRIGRDGNGTDAFFGRVSRVFVNTSTISAEDVLGIYDSTKDYYNAPGEVFAMDSNDSSSYSVSNNQILDLTGNLTGYAVSGLVAENTENGGVFNLTSGNYLTFGDNVGLCSPKKITLEAWINLSNFTTSNLQSIIGLEGNFGMELGEADETNPNGSLRFYKQGSNGYQFVYSSINASDFNNKWNHVVSTYEDGFTKIYLNGVLLVESTDITEEIIRSSAYLNIGYAGLRGNSFNGSIGLAKIYDYVLNSDQVNAAYNERKARFSSAASYLLLNYDVNNTGSFVEGDTTIHSLVNTYEGTLNNGVAFSTESINGSTLKSLSFDGSDDYIQIANAPKPANTMTISAWVNASDLNGWKKAVTFPYGENSWDAPYFSYQIAGNNNKLGVGFNVNGDYNTGSLFSPSDAVVNAWYHVVGTFNNGIIKLYVNGQSVDTKDVSASGTSIMYTDRADLVIGLNAEYFQAEQFAGKIATVKIYDNSLTDSQILADYNQSKANFKEESANGIYSLRKVEATYSGNAIKVRRSSDNTEQEIGFVNGELDVDSLTSFAGAGNAFVSVWFDQSGYAHNLKQTTAARQPKIVNNGSVMTLEGKPAVYFDNNYNKNYVLKTDRTSGLYDTQNLTAFVVGSKDSDVDGSCTHSRFVSFNYDTNADYNTWDGFLMGAGGVGTAYSYCAGNIADDVVYVTGTRALFTGTRTFDSNGNYYMGIAVNDNYFTTTGIPQTTMNSDTLRIGNDPGESDSKLKGYIQEVIVFDKAIPARVEPIKNEINTYYNIYQSSEADTDGYSLILNFEGNYDDNGGSNLIPTLNGNPAISSDAKLGSGSVYFAEKQDGLIYASRPEFKFGSGDFTFETWVKFTSSDNAQCIFSNYSNWSTGSIYFGKHPGASGRVSFWSANLGVPMLMESESTENEWVHYAVVRSGNTFTMYKNGTSVASTSASGSIGNTNTPFFVGYAGDSPTGYGLIGYLDSFKVSKVARYTGDFTPEGWIPPPPPYINELVLSYDMSDANSYSGSGTAIYDLSGYSNIGTLSGDFVYENEYSGVIDFGGTDATIAINNTGNITPPKITFETWVKPSDISTYRELFRMESNGLPIYLFSFQESNILSFGLNTSISGYNELDVTLDPSTVVEKWCHFVATYESGSKKLYLNGALIGEAYDEGTINFEGANFAHVGSSAGVVEFLDGKVALFNMYNYPLTSTEVSDRYNNTKSRFDDGSISIDGQSSLAYLYKGAAFNPTKNEFTFDGVNDYAKVPNQSFGTSDFALSWWEKPSASQSGTIRKFGNINTTGWSTNDWTIGQSSNNDVIFYVYNHNGLDMFSSQIQIDIWQHFAITRNGDIWSLYINGNLITSVESSVSLDGGSNRDFYIGTSGILTELWNGKISGLEIQYSGLSATQVTDKYNTQLPDYLVTFQATGGTITTDGTYNYHTFTSSGTFEVVDGEGEIEALIIAGGAAAGGNVGGGGGAGGLLIVQDTLTQGTYSISVGSGGAGSFVNYTAGGNSTFNGHIALGGGKPGGDGVLPTNGGSGGGGSAGAVSMTASLGTPGQGNNGGNGQSLPGGPNGGGGGGGGAATVGYSPVNGSGGHAGHGGNGLQLTEWSSATSTGVNNRYAAGGGGGGYTPYGQAGGFGGNGGGGNGAGYGDGTSGTVNSGSGAGAGSGGYASNGGNGGSGIIIVRYLI